MDTRGKVQAKGLGKMEAGIHLPRTGALHRFGMSQRSGKPDLKPCQGEVRRRSQLREKNQELTSLMPKEKKEHQHRAGEHQSKLARNLLELAVRAGQLIKSSTGVAWGGGLGS